MKFQGRVAFITGASRGVGKNLALALAPKVAFDFKVSVGRA